MVSREPCKPPPLSLLSLYLGKLGRGGVWSELGGQGQSVHTIQGGVPSSAPVTQAPKSHSALPTLVSAPVNGETTYQRRFQDDKSIGKGKAGAVRRGHGPTLESRLPRPPGQNALLSFSAHPLPSSGASFLPPAPQVLGLPLGLQAGGHLLLSSSSSALSQHAVSSPAHPSRPCSWGEST